MSTQEIAAHLLLASAMAFTPGSDTAQSIALAADTPSARRTTQGLP